MHSIIYIVTSFLSLAICQSEVKVSDFVYWKKADISAWNQYFPGRALKEELVTNAQAVTAVQSVAEGLKDSLSRVVQYQAQELGTAQLMMEGTSAQGCVRGIASYMDTAIQQEISTYSDCTADVLPKLERLNTSLSKINSNYQAAFQRALAGIDKCAQTYPNKDSLTRLQICVESWNKNYFSVADSTKKEILAKSSMDVFMTTVASCAQDAASQVVDKAWAFLAMLVRCANLSENIDGAEYEADMTAGFNNYLTSSNLMSQLSTAQSLYTYQVQLVEQAMFKYYDLQKRALEKYVIESRSQGYYSNQMLGYLGKYFTIVSTALADNPGDAQCSIAANSDLQVLVNTGSSEALQCDQKVVNNTKLLIRDVNNVFTQVNDKLPSLGNSAILSCFSKGFIFAEQTIINCYSLVSYSTVVDLIEAHDNVVKEVEVLKDYESNFFDKASLPCDNTTLRRINLRAEQILDDLERCLYISSGTKYVITHPTRVEDFAQNVPSLS